MKRIVVFLLFSGFLSLFFLRGNNDSVSVEKVVTELKKLDSYSEIITKGEKYLNHEKFLKNQEYLLLMATAYINRNFITHGIKLAKLLNKDHPYHYFLTFLGDFLLGNKKEALQILENLKQRIEFGKIKKNYLQLYYSGRAEVFLSEGKLKEAKEELDKVLEITPSPESYYYYLISKYYFLQNDFEKAKEYLLKFKQKEGETAYPYAIETEIALKNGKLKEAYSLLQKILPLYDKKGNLWCDGIMAGLYYQKLKNDNLPKINFFNSLPLTFDTKDNLKQLILKLSENFYTGNFEEASKQAKSLVWTMDKITKGELQLPKNLETEYSIVLSLAEILLATFQREIFPKTYQNYIQILLKTHVQEKNPPLYTYLITFSNILHLYQQEKYEEALENLKKLPQEKEKITSIYLPLLQQYLNDSNLVQTNTDKIWNLYQITYFLLKGDILLALHDWEKAIDSYKIAYKINPDFFRKLEIEIKSKEENLNPENIFFATGRDISDLLYELAVFHLKCQETDRAKTLISKAITLFPEREKLLFFYHKIK